MVINVPQEGKIWQLAAATLGVESLAHLVVELLASYVKTRPVDILGYLRSEWLELVPGPSARRSDFAQCGVAKIVRRSSRHPHVQDPHPSGR